MKNRSIPMVTTAISLSAPAFASLENLLARANDYAFETRSPCTRRAYLSDFRSFEAWCAPRTLVAIPATAAVIAIYLVDLADAGKRPSTIERALAGILHAHRARGHAPPRGEPIARVLSGIRRRHGSAPAQKVAVGDDALLAMVSTLDDTLLGIRDRALLTLGWFGAFRRSELVALTVEDIARIPQGLRITVRRSKGDCEGRGAQKGIPFASNPNLCAVRAVGAWLAAAGITSGPIFRYVDRHGHVHAKALCGKSVALVVQRTAARAGLDPKTVAAHSLRAGFATTAARKGKSLDAIMRQTLHKSERVARAYLRHASLFDDNAASGLA
jgi:site-specific recombinase XerD